MSQPTNGSWNDGQGDQGQGGSLGQGWNDQSNQGSGSLGQDWGGGQQQASAPAQDYGQQQGGYGQQGGQEYGQQYGQQGGYDQSQQQYGAPAQHGGSFAPNAKADGLGDLFSDLKFRKSLTENIAQFAFLGVLVWAVLQFLASTIYNFGSQDFGGTSVRHMSNFNAVLNLFADLVWLVVVVAGARLLLELFINVARIATGRTKD